MLRFLWGVYRAAPAWAKSLIRRGSWIPRLLLRPFVRRVHTAGFDMYLNFGDNGSIRYLRWGNEYEKRLRSIFLRLIEQSPNCVVIDAGASYGAFALSAAAIGRAAPIGRILGVEPDERCVSALRRSVTANGFEGRVRVIHALAGDIAGETELHMSAAASTSNRSFASLENDDAFFSRRAVRVLPTVRLDDVIEAVPRPDPLRIVMKVDVEESEGRVLQGTRQTLRDAASCAVLLRVLSYRNASGAAGLRECKPEFDGASMDTMLGSRVAGPAPVRRSGIALALPE